MSAKMIGGLCLGFLGASAVGVAAADVEEYTTFASWAPHVRGAHTTVIGGLTPNQQDIVLGPSVTFGPGTFAPAANNGYIFNDGDYGTGVQYIADSPQSDGQSSAASITVSFNASAGVTALSFALGTYDKSSGVDVSVNGSPLSPVFVSGARPGSAFFGVTDTSSPIKTITFTSASTGELDLVDSYSTAKAIARAPEIDIDSMASALALLFGMIAVLRGRERKVRLVTERAAL